MAPFEGGEEPSPDFNRAGMQVYRHLDGHASPEKEQQVRTFSVWSWTLSEKCTPPPRKLCVVLLLQQKVDQWVRG